MKSEQIVSWLRDKAARAEERDYQRMLTVAAERIVGLEKELREEMHRHDRLQDFEVAEARLLAEYKNTGLTPDQVAFLVSPDMQEKAQLMKECLEMIQGGAEVQIFGLPAERVLQLVEQEKAGARNRWIPVTERLPDLIPCGAGTAYSEAVNVLTSGRKVLTAIWDGTDFIADAEFWEAEGEEITHWTAVSLPLPELAEKGR